MKTYLLHFIIFLGCFLKSKKYIFMVYSEHKLHKHLKKAFQSVKNAVRFFIGVKNASRFFTSVKNAFCEKCGPSQRVN